MICKGAKVPDHIHCFGIPKDLWYATLFALRDAGWSLDMGGGLEHSWAVLERDGRCIKMEYDIWAEGEMVVDAADAETLKASLPATTRMQLGLL